MNEQITDDAPLTKSKPLRPLTMREERFAQGLLEGKTQRESAVIAGYSPASAETIASEKMRSLSFRQNLQAHALAQGIGVEFALGKLQELVNADTLVLGGKDKDREYWVQDGATRSKGVDMFLKVMGAYPDPRADVNVSALTTVVLRSADSLAVDPFAVAGDGPAIDGEAREIDGGTDGLP